MKAFIERGKKENLAMEIERVDPKDINKEITLIDVFRGLEKTDCVYYYTAWKYNCQNFVHNFLMLSVDKKKVMEKYDSFFYQPKMNKYFDGNTLNGVVAKKV